jgi:hypothetical protein
MRSELFACKPNAMSAHRLLRALDRFSQWFDRRFGWFFTNGMKAPGAPAERPVRA